MTTAQEAAGRPDRELARALVSALPDSAGRALRLGPVDLARSAEHLLYTARRQPTPDASPPTLLRSLARIGRAVAGGRSSGSDDPTTMRAAVFVSRSVHVTLYEPVERLLSEAGVESILVDAETRASTPVFDGVQLRLGEMRPSRAGRLLAHATTVHARLRRMPSSWVDLASGVDGVRLHQVLRRGLPLAALEAARIDAVLRALRPSVTVAFSESGLLARTLPAVAADHGIPSLDLPHAEAADPWGVAGAGYDGFAVYGPRSRRALEVGGIAPTRIVEIGPLRYDALLGRPPRPAMEAPRRVVFASQPADPRKPATHPDVKRAALSASRAAAGALSPAEVVVIPHPIEPDGEAERFVEELGADGPALRVERTVGLHDVLPGAWLLVTASSQSVFEAVLSGVPAMTVNSTRGPDPVSFAEEGIAIGVTSDHEAAKAAAVLLSPAARADAVERGREALGDRIGPLDGRAAERAASWIRSVATADATASGGRARR